MRARDVQELPIPAHVILNHCFQGTAPRRPAAAGHEDRPVQVIAVSTRYEAHQQPKFVTNLFYSACDDT